MNCDNIGSLGHAGETRPSSSRDSGHMRPVVTTRDRYRAIDRRSHTDFALAPTRAEGRGGNPSIRCRETSFSNYFASQELMRAVHSRIEDCQMLTRSGVSGGPRGVSSDQRNTSIKRQWIWNIFLQAHDQRVAGQRFQIRRAHSQDAERQVLEIPNNRGLRGDKLASELVLRVGNGASVAVCL